MAKKDHNGESELITCSKCGKEKTLYYDQLGVVVSESRCNCNKKIYPKGKKPLDIAIKKLPKELLKWLKQKK